MAVDLPAGAKQTVAIHFVTPHHAGTYRLRLYWQSSTGREAAGEFEIEVEGEPRLGDLESVRLSQDKPLAAARVGTVQLQVVNRGVKTVDFEGVASLRLETSESAQQTEDFQRLQIHLAPGHRTVVSLYLPAPSRPGSCPLSLSLGARFSKMSFQLGQLSVALAADEERG